MLLGSCSIITSLGEERDTSDYDDYREPYSETEPTFDYEGTSSTLAEIIDEYPAQGEGEYASCRVIYSSTDESLVFTMEADRFVEGPDNTYILQYSSPEKAAEAQAKLAANASVRYAEPDVLVTGDGFYSWGTIDMGTDTFSTQMAFSQTYIPTIAVVDSGVNYHEMIGRMLPGWDFVANDRDPRDEHGHGTHVAGTVSDVMGDMAHTILPVRVLDHNKQGYSSQVVLGIRYAADNGADIINLSFGGPHSDCKEEAISYAIGKGCSVVVSAGNDTQDVYYKCPAHIPSAVTVSAVDSNYNLASFSNFGTGVDICAPGVNILSANYLGGTVAMSGTSMAAPHISGILGLILASGTAETSYEAESILFASCIDLGDAGKDYKYGYGYPNMDKIMEAYMEKQRSNDYWTLYQDVRNPQAIANIWFSEDGTYETIDLATGERSTGTYFGLGDYQLTFWEDTPTYFMGMDFFDNTGRNYETSSTYQSNVIHDPGGQFLEYCTGIHPYTDMVVEKPQAPANPAPAQPSSPLSGTIDLGDGTYYVDFYLNSLRTNGYDCALTVDFLGAIELSSGEVYNLTPGTYYGGNFTLNVEYVQFENINGIDYLEINSWEYARYIPERDVWRFYTVNDLPLSYYVTTGDVLISGSATLWDYLTPFIFEQNAIGMQQGDFMEKTDSFYCTASIADFCDWHATMSPYMVSEKAYITVQNGIVTTMTINAHP